MAQKPRVENSVPMQSKTLLKYVGYSSSVCIYVVLFQCPALVLFLSLYFYERRDLNAFTSGNGQNNKLIANKPLK